MCTDNATGHCNASNGPGTCAVYGVPCHGARDSAEKGGDTKWYGPARGGGGCLLGACPARYPPPLAQARPPKKKQAKQRFNTHPVLRQACARL